MKYGLIHAGTLSATQLHQLPVAQALRSRDVDLLVLLGAPVQTRGVGGQPSFGYPVATIIRTLDKLLADERLRNDPAVRSVLDDPEDAEIHGPENYGLVADRTGYLGESQLIECLEIVGRAEELGLEVRDYIRGSHGFPSPRSLSGNRQGWPLPAVLEAIRSFPTREA